MVFLGGQNYLGWGLVGFEVQSLGFLLCREGGCGWPLGQSECSVGGICWLQVLRRSPWLILCLMRLTHGRQLSFSCNCTSRESNALSWPPGVHACMQHTLNTDFFFFKKKKNVRNYTFQKKKYIDLVHFSLYYQVLYVCIYNNSYSVSKYGHGILESIFGTYF